MGENYKKEFNTWNIFKQKIHNFWQRNQIIKAERKDLGSGIRGIRYIHEREVWWCSLGVNVGFEQDGKGPDFSRPVVVLKTFSQNACLVVPLTSKDKKGIFYFDIGIVDGERAKAVISQIRFIDISRFVNKVDVINKDTFEKLMSAIVQINFSLK